MAYIHLVLRGEKVKKCLTYVIMRERVGMTLTSVGKRSVSEKKRKKVRSVINITYCLIHPKAIFKKLLVYSRVS